MPPRLADALDEIKDAIDHEEDAADALDEAGARADDYAGGEIEDAMDHLENALDDLEAAVAAGEISAGEAAAISRLVREALGHDRDALGTIDDEDPVRDTLADLDDALADKEEVGDWIYYGDDLDFADLGCKINVFGVAGDVGAGYDACAVAIVALQLQMGWAFSRFSNGFVGQGNQPISQFPCLVALWILTCRPPQALVPPNQYIYAFVGPALAVMTAHWALAYGQNGRVHRARFVTGNVQATDLGIRTTLRDLTPYGYVRTAGSATAPRLGTGIGYVYQAEVENEGGGVALNATADITLPAGFTVNRIYPRSCSRSGTMVRCPLGALYADYSGLISIWGMPAKAGAVMFRSTISSGATEPATDPNANSATTSAKVYGVPRTSIVGVSSSILKGRAGAIAGQARPGATFEPPLERIRKVEMALLRTQIRAASATPKKCLWLNRAGGFTSVPGHRGACDKGVWLAAKGTSAWTYTLKKGLPKGTYSLYARGTNVAGITTRTFSGRLKNAASFRVK